VHGASFAPRAVAVFDELRRAAQDISLVSSGAHGTLRVGIGADAGDPDAAVRSTASRTAIPASSCRWSRPARRAARSLRRRDIEVAIPALACSTRRDLRRRRCSRKRSASSRPGTTRSPDAAAYVRICCGSAGDAPPDCIFYEHVQATLRSPACPCHTTCRGILHPHPVRDGAARGLLSFGMRSQTVFAPGKEFLVRLPFDLRHPHGGGGRVAQVARAQPVVRLCREHPRHRRRYRPAHRRRHDTDARARGAPASRRGTLVIATRAGKWRLPDVC